MKILVGTLFCGENEYADCLASIKKQTFQNYDHLVIENLPELEAHYKLYQTFIDRSEDYQILIKVDADTVLLSEYLFENIAEKMQKNQWLEVMNIGVSDFFTGEMIPAGIQIYRNTVRWNFEKDTVFPDVPLLDPDRYLYDKTELAPAATHCQNPSPAQAFHYGVHRGLKSVQRIHSTTHWRMLQKVWENFLACRDTRLGLAVLGAELVYEGVFNREHQNYTNKKMDEVLTHYLDYSSDQIKNEIQKKRFLRWGFLPTDLRQRVIRQLRGKMANNWDV